MQVHLAAQIEHFGLGRLRSQQFGHPFHNPRRTILLPPSQELLLDVVPHRDVIHHPNILLKEMAVVRVRKKTHVLHLSAL